MKWIKLILVSLPFVTSQKSDSKPNRWCNNSPSICLTMDLMDNETAKFKMEGPASSGYFSFGLGKAMAGSDMFFAWSENNQPKLEYRQGHSHNAPNRVDNITLAMLDDETSIKDDKITVSFTRSFHQGQVTIQPDSPINFIWAYSDSQPKSGEFARHSNRGGFTMDLNKSKSTDPEGDPTSSTPDETVGTPFLVILHGVVMMVAWVGLPPIAIFIARYLKGALGVWWFRAHIAVFLLVGILSVVGVVAMVSFMGNALDHPHSIIGVIVLVLYLVQIVLGTVVDRLYQPNRLSPPWYDQLHWWVGRSAVGLGVINVVSGISLMSTASSPLWWSGFGILLVINYLLFAFGSSRYPPNTDHHPTGPSEDHPSSHHLNPDLTRPNMMSLPSQSSLVTTSDMSSHTGPVVQRAIPKWIKQ